MRNNDGKEPRFILNGIQYHIMNNSNRFLWLPRKVVLALFDLVCLLAVDVLYYLIVMLIPNVEYPELSVYFINSLILVACVVAMRFTLGVYATVWRYTDTRAYLMLIISDTLGALVAWLLTILTPLPNATLHYSAVAPIALVVALAARFCYRQLYRRTNRADKSIHKIPVAIIGAGQIGALLAEELAYSEKSHYKPLFFIDKDKSKAGGKVSGLRVYQENDETIEFIKSQPVSEIFIALPKLDSERAEEIFQKYSPTGCKIKLYDMPVRNMNEVQDTSVRPRGTIREFQVEDLLFRKSMSINDRASFDYYRDKVVLVTGGGGSIGSEICRQLAKCHPKQLIILDIYENNAYDIQQELLREYGNKLDLCVEIASVRDRKRLEAVFAAYRPQIVFHAAAHKHVPLMEHSGCEAIKNNVMGTYNTADMAEKFGAEKFILVSTDKAVNPTNIMGASKRMCEMIIQCRTDSKTSFAAVRFGNVLGSNGSVIPLFKRQIASGGPITLTDKNIIRYFMTIPEASQLVMEAGAMAQRGELFVLDMGKPVKIYDLALNMIKLSGLVPEKDIKIVEIGLRPGEKLFEELLMKTETLDKTSNNMIFIEKDTPLSREEVDRKIDLLCRAVRETENDIASPRIKEAMMQAVPTFRNPEEINCTAMQSEEMKEARDDLANPVTAQ